ncbi:MAG: tRNA (adenosine(37)-N6)-threonylcarbamoyltransferase complex ATPase subunit type 1 TsaE [Polyangiaceae bacterium]
MHAPFRSGRQATAPSTRSTWVALSWLAVGAIGVALGCSRGGAADRAPKPNWAETLNAGRAARRIDSTWHGGAEAEQRATERKLVEFIERYPTDPKCTGMRLRLAWIRIGQSRIEEARRLIDSVAEDATGVDADWVTTLRAALSRRSGDVERALASFMTLNGKIVDGALRDIWAEEAIAAALGAARLETATDLLVTFRANGSEERLLQTDGKIESIIVRLNGEALLRALDKLSHDVSLPVADESTRQARRQLLELVRARLALWVLKENDAALSRRVLENAPPKFLRSEVGEQLVRLSELAISPVLTLHASVGLLLEMQDDFSSRRSAELMTGAMRALDAGSKESPVRLVSRDIRTTDRAAIAEGFKALVSDGAGILVAGITSATTTEALRVARDEGVVVVSLSGQPGPVQPASWFGVVDVSEVASKLESGAVGSSVRARHHGRLSVPRFRRSRVSRGRRGVASRTLRPHRRRVCSQASVRASKRWRNAECVARSRSGGGARRICLRHVVDESEIRRATVHRSRAALRSTVPPLALLVRGSGTRRRESRGSRAADRSCVGSHGHSVNRNDAKPDCRGVIARARRAHDFGGRRIRRLATFETDFGQGNVACVGSEGGRRMNQPHEVVIGCRRDTRKLARALGRVVAPGNLVVLEGQLGSGKTFFVRALCRALGLPERIRVTSPTFSLVHEIDTKPRMSHADLYRLSSARDVAALGLVERRDEGDLVVAEWATPYIDVLGGDALVVEFVAEPRRARLSSTGPRAAQALASLRLILV